MALVHNRFTVVNQRLCFSVHSTSFFARKNGGQLATASRGLYNLSFTYDDNGIRTSKTVNGVEHVYTLSGRQIVSEAWGNELLIYIYDAQGSPIGMQYRSKGMAAADFDTYWFEKNLQGDIIAVYTETGLKVCSYVYDAWGNFTFVPDYDDGVNSGDAQCAGYNPFRYRGYYYDSELGMYYLQSRYYDPNTGRFINADRQLNGSILGYNLFAYCENNPVMWIDPTGNWPSWGQVLAAVATVAVAAVFVAAVVSSAGAVGVAAGVFTASIGATGNMVSAAITLGTLGTYFVAGGIGACALSDAGEILTGTNVIRDGLMGGNQETYDIIKAVLYIAGAGATIIGQTNPGVTGDAAKPNQDAQPVHKVPKTGTPNTSFDKLYPGKTGEFQRTYYDFRGNISLQIDFTTHNQPLEHSNPHLHTFWFGERQPQINLRYLE